MSYSVITSKKLDITLTSCTLLTLERSDFIADIAELEAVVCVIAEISRSGMLDKGVGIFVQGTLRCRTEVKR